MTVLYLLDMICLTSCLYLCVIEPLQKLMERLWSCKTSLSPKVILYHWSFKGDASVVVLTVLCLGVEFLCCLHLICVFILFVKFG